MFTVAHLSDCHIDGSARNAERLRRAVSYVRDSSALVDAVVVTGDVADHGAAEEYETALRLLDLCRTGDLPVMLLPGNHDERKAFRAAIGAGVEDGPVNQRRVVGDRVFLLLDSTIPGRDDGELTAPTLDWLGAQLRDATGAIVCLHHPPVHIGHPGADSMRLRNPDDLRAVIGDSGTVAAILTGHTHTAAATEFAGVPLRIAPGIASSLKLPGEFRTNANIFADTDVPPGIALHAFLDHGPVTHFRTVA